METLSLMNENTLIDFINHELLINKKVDESICEDTDLIAANVIDSLSLIQLITFLERSLQIKIEDTEVNPDNFQSVAAILKFLKEKIN